MTHTIEVIYTDGVLKPTSELPLRDNQRVRLTVETVDENNKDREAAASRLKAGIASMRFFSEGPPPSREELHDRVDTNVASQVRRIPKRAFLL